MTASMRLQVRPPHASVLIGNPGLRQRAIDDLIRNGWSWSGRVEPATALILVDSDSADRAHAPAAHHAEHILFDEETAIDALAPAIATWDPRPLVAPALRLADTFGAEAMIAQFRAFRAQLEEALAGFQEPGLAARAHRIAGLSGTLGFAECSAAWLALSERVADGEEPARREARRAILAIDTLFPEPARGPSSQ